MPLSSAFLYVGIVVIWALVLVPRLLRRPQVPEPTADAAYYHGEADYDEQPGYEQPGYQQDGYEQDGHEQDGHEQRAADPGGAPAGGGAFEIPPAPVSPEVPPARRPVSPLRRSRVLQARRRLLTLLLLLFAAAATGTMLKLTSWWACVPPAGLLGMYLLLLREAALADAVQARRRAALEMRVQDRKSVV